MYKPDLKFLKESHAQAFKIAAKAKASTLNFRRNKITKFGIFLFLTDSEFMLLDIAELFVNR